MTSDSLSARLAEQASQALEPVYGMLTRVAEEVLRSRPPRGPLTEAHFSNLQRMLAEMLGMERSIVWGMGFVAAPFVVESQERYMAWWQRINDRPARLRLNFDPRSIDVYDYLQMDWYRLAESGQARVAYGPYVDYSGSDMYTITATIPIAADGAFLGLAGADLVVGEVEHRLLEVLRQTSEDAVVVNAERRVIAANTPRWIVGSRLTAMPAVGPSSDPSRFTEVTELPLGNGWVLAIAEPDGGAS